MILTITLNASIDKTARVNNLAVGKINRIDKPVEMAGGKGLNVTRALKTYNLESVATGFIGGKSGEMLKDLLNKDNITHDFFEVNDNTRSCLALVDDNNNLITEINENGPYISPKELEGFLKKVDLLASKAKVAVISGSVPKSLSQNVYLDLINICKKHNVLTALDASGQHLKNGLGGYPHIIKPNQHEAEELLEFSLDSTDKYLQAVYFLTHYCQIAAITLEDQGCIIGNKNQIYHLRSPKVKVVNTVGSGDSFLAGMIYALNQNKDILDIGKYGIATGTANVLTDTAGLCNKSDIDNIFEKYRSREIIMTEIIIADNIQEISKKLAEDIFNSFLNTKGDFNIAISGGNSPKTLFNILAVDYKDKFEWNRVHIFWVDERCVAPDSSESNYLMTRQNLINKININPENIHRIKGEIDPQIELKRYTEEIKKHLSFENNYPQFDYIILGMGNDGHTASIFPEHYDDINSKDICLIAQKPNSKQLRISLTIPSINNAKSVSFLITGDDKALLLKQVIEEKSIVYPASFIQNENLKFFLDKNVADLLDNN